MAIEFTKATSFLKGTVTASFRTMTQLVKDANSEHKFNEWIHNEQKQWAIKAGSAEAEQTAESIRFFFKLVAVFVFQYTQERSFFVQEALAFKLETGKQIKIVAGHSW